MYSNDGNVVRPQQQQRIRQRVHQPMLVKQQMNSFNNKQVSLLPSRRNMEKSPFALKKIMTPSYDHAKEFLIINNRLQAASP